MEKNKPKLIPEKLQIIDVKFNHAEVNSLIETDNKLIKDFENQVAVVFGFNLKDNLLKAEIKLNIEGFIKNKKIKAATCEFEISYIFSVENLESFTSKNEEGAIVYDFNLGNAVASIVYSTSRGILLTRLQGTPFSNFILPVINPNDLL